MKENHSHKKDNNNQGILPVFFFYSHKYRNLIGYKLCDSIFNIFNTKDAIMFNILPFPSYRRHLLYLLSGSVFYILTII